MAARRSRDTILAVPVAEMWVYPACQFDTDGILPGIGDSIKAFRDAEPWTRLMVLFAPSERFGSLTALDLLKAGRVDDAKAVAGGYGEQG